MSNPHQSATSTAYVGRFAPSPTGPLHLGSLLAAVASFVDARSHQGSWLLRMEDLDPPREPEGAAEQILDQLQGLGLQWDGEVLYQSTRLHAYEEALHELEEKSLTYSCDCTRPQIKAMGSFYDGRCRERRSPPENEFALRVRTEAVSIEFEDLVQGRFQQVIEKDVGDFVIKRKDKLFAYQLAVVVDDAFQGINRIIRGFDLLDSTPRQIYLQHLLHYPTPVYGHIPVIVNDQGQKLSKQHFAESIDLNKGEELVHFCLQLLGQNPPDINQSASTQEQLQWAAQNWDIHSVPKLANIFQDSPN